MERWLCTASKKMGEKGWCTFKATIGLEVKTNIMGKEKQYGRLLHNYGKVASGILHHSVFALKVKTTSAQKS